MEVSDQLQAMSASLLVKEPLVPIGQEAGFASGMNLTLWSSEKYLSPDENRTLDVRHII